VAERIAQRRTGRVTGIGLVALAIAVTSCGGASPSSQPPPAGASLPSVSALCPPVSELDFYVAVPTGSATSEHSSDEGTSPTVTCSYGDPARSPRRSAVVSYELFPPKSARYPAGVKVHRMHDIGAWAISYRRGHVTHVVVDEGYVAVSVSSDAGAGDLLGLAEDELARVPIAERS
jgi:hypothetical protein